MIRAYFNLHKRTFSIQRRVEGSWRVTEYSDSILIKNAVFKVYESGRKRVLRERRKNVHGYVIGEEVLDKKNLFPIARVTYNPYLNSSFMAGEREIKEAPLVMLSLTNENKPIIELCHLGF